MPASGRSVRREREGGRLVLLVIVGLFLLAGGGYTAAYLGAGDRIPRGVTVAGVDVGGHSPAEAVRLLRAGLADRVDTPITVRVDGRSAAVSPDRAGLSVDYVASVSAAGAEQSWDPHRLWDYYTDGADLDAVIGVAELPMRSTLQHLAEGLGRPARNGTVTFGERGISVVKPRPGEQVDPDAARAAITAAYLQDGATVDLTLQPAQPDIDAADVQEALDDFANPAMSGPVTLVFGHSRVQLSPRDYAAALRMKPEDGALVPAVDLDTLTALVDDQIRHHGTPVDATVAMVDGSPEVVPAKHGVSYEPEAVRAAFLRVVAQEGDRRVTVPATFEKADFTTEDARALKIRERVSTFTTYFPDAGDRNGTIDRAAELVDGTVLEPGDTFSLNDTVGPLDDRGDGVSQVATTVFNAMFLAGLKDVEHQPHHFYLDRYPVGREATVAWGSVDLRFQNDTPYGVLIDAHVTPSTPSSPGVVTVSMWSTKHWDITTSTSERHDVTAPGVRHLSGPGCHPTTGHDGFDVDVVRSFRKPGESALDHEETFHTRYAPSDTVVCG